ncbi:hypothetical protein MKX03_016532 [Papaver bracteatum]|nr:hypothetical protein MKX03_016532 [Papaver bracteatum]
MKNDADTNGGREEVMRPLLEGNNDYHGQNENDLARRVWVESKKLWHIAGPGIFSRISGFSITIITVAFAGNLGNLELASISIAINVFMGFNFGLMLGMASALETLCGQAYGAKRYRMLGIFLQRSWIVQLVTTILLLPLFFFISLILRLLGQPDDVAELSGLLSLWLIPLHFAYAFQFPLQRFLQSQRKAYVSAWISFFAVTIHIFISWLFVHKLGVGIIGSAITINISWWILDLGLFCYVVCGGYPETWGGFSADAFSGLWDYFKLSAASGVMLCLEVWYYRILMLMTGKLNNVKIAVSALAVCMNINTWEMMIPLAFFAATGVRVANELGAGNGKAAKFASVVSATTSMIIGLCICTLIIIFHEKLSFLFTSSDVVIQAVDKLTYLLGITILLNSIQPILSGVAVGSGWQASVAYINLGCYYVVGVPLGVTLGWVFHLGVGGIWSGMIGGTIVQTLILIIMTMRCDWDMQAEKVSWRMRMLATPPSKP